MRPYPRFFPRTESVFFPFTDVFFFGTAFAWLLADAVALGVSLAVLGAVYS